MKKLFGIVFFLTRFQAFSQVQDPYSLFKDTIDIKFVQLTDTALVAQIKSYIIKTQLQDSNFVSKGYIELMVSNHISPDKSEARSYYVKKTYSGFDNVENDHRFPLYYSYVNEKLVVVRLLDCSSRIAVSIPHDIKQQFQKTVEPYLPSRSDDRRTLINLGGGIYIWTFPSGKAPIIKTAKEAGFYH